MKRFGPELLGGLGGDAAGPGGGRLVDGSGAITAGGFGDSPLRLEGPGAAANNWLAFDCFGAFSRVLVFFFVGPESLPASPLGVATFLGVGAGLAPSFSVGAASKGQVGAAARFGRRRSPPVSESCVASTSLSPPFSRLVIKALDLGLGPLPLRFLC